MKRTTPGTLLTASAFALTAFSTVVFAGAPAAGAATGENGYVQLSTGGTLRAATAGVCVRTGYWTPGMANSECDPELLPKTPPASVPVQAPPPAKPKPIAPTPPAKPVPPAPAAKPKPPAAVAPVIEKITLQTDALFDFDRAVIRKDASSKLDDLVSKMKGINLEVVIAVGHADRLGSDAYNLKLSARRAEAVKNYLVSKGIPANRVYTEGKGERQPVKNCTERNRKTLIACLQPNRRVDVEVVGTRRK